MKRYAFTIALAVLLCGFVGYLYLVELPAEKAKTRQETQEKRLLPFDQQEITGLTVRTQGEEIVLVPGGPGTWKMSAPLQTEADNREVEALVRALILGNVSRVVEEKATALGPFGLEKPAMVLTIAADDRKETLSIGDIGPISSTLYVMRESDKTVLLSDLAAKDFLNKRLFTFRRKELLRFDQTQAERIRLTYPQIEIVLYRTDQLDRTKRNKWMLRSPLEAPADATEVRLLLTKLEDLKALGFIDPGPERDSIAKTFKEPRAKLTIHVAGTEHTVKLFQPDPSTGEAYAVTSPEAPIYRITPAVLKDLSKDLFALQDKRLLGVETEDIAMLTVKTREERYTLINQTGTWVLESKPEDRLDQQKVGLFVSRVASLPAELLVVKKVGPLAPYGLSSPSAEFTVTGKDGKLRGRLILGAKTSGLVYAMGQGLPGIYQARADLLTQIPPTHDLLAGTDPGGALPPP
jgi:hypothetical protein